MTKGRTRCTQIYWMALGMILFGFLATASAQQIPSQYPLTPDQNKGDTITPVPGRMHVIIQETPAPDTIPPEAMVPPAVTVRRVHQPAGGHIGMQAVVFHQKDKSESMVQEGDEIEGWKVLSITDRVVTIEKKISDRRAVRALMPVGGVFPIQNQPAP
jgi:hypothetical protein